MIASEAKDKSQNRLDTGTISFSDIENKADYQVSSSSAGVSSSGMPSMPTSRNKNESEHSTTHSAVSEGTIIIRNKDDQKQDINELSRDTEQANNELKHIFNKQKEQDIIDQTQLVSEIGGETLTMLNHIDRIRAESKAKEAVEKEKEKGKNKGLTEEEQQKIYEDAYKESMNEGMSAMGSDTRQGIDMAVSIINGLILAKKVDKSCLYGINKNHRRQISWSKNLISNSNNNQWIMRYLMHTFLSANLPII
ncbi:hypothetical protein [Gilliamella sp. Bif1-4]|uniref:hypothetical protein n=1 Tax=Gilliamella sp. Bif1-4 TaxID=3120233 RepID=UPI00080E73E2|nr:hypothetical protein [Gilliamella apicola]OCG42953.1 hypothetical protein A9G25_00725 [Gilliamella apicola]